MKRCKTNKEHARTKSETSPRERGGRMRLAAVRVDEAWQKEGRKRTEPTRDDEERRKTTRAEAT